MNTPIFDWNHARAFLATAERGSLSAAARKLGLTQPTIGRQVAALEAELGLMLFERIGRSLVLTAAGAELAQHMRAMQEGADRAALAATGQAQSAEGLVRITASDIVSAHLLPAALVQLRRVAPRLTIEIVATNDISDLMRREADIAVRHVRPEQPDLIARLVQEPRAWFCAARSYMATVQRPKTLDDMARLDFVAFGDVDRAITEFARFGLRLSPANFRASSASGLVAWEMVRRGLGVTPMMECVIQACPDIEILLPEREPIVFPVWLVTHRELHTSRRIRLVYDHLADFLRRGISP